MSEQEYTTLRARPINQLLQIPAKQMALFLQDCSPQIRAQLNQVRWKR